MKAHRPILSLAAAALLVLGSTPASARIKLAALPERERVEIQLDNGRFTLVEEERIVPLLRGANRIDFAWSNTGVDKNTVRFRPIAIRDGAKFRAIAGKEIAVVNVAYPPNENALVWEIYSRQACAVKVRVSYLIQRLGRTFAYRALADREETHLTLKKYLQLRNYSGEDFGDAGVWAGFGPHFTKQVGQQTDIKMLLERFERVPIAKTYTFDWYTHGALNPDKPKASKVLMHYRLKNDERNGLGRFPLQPGKVRIFIADGHGGEAFLGEDWASLTPIGGAMRLYLGESRDIICTRIIERNQRHPVQGNLFHQELVLRYEIENFKDKAATLDIVEQINRLAAEYGATAPGDAEWELGAETTRDVSLTYEHGRALPVLHVPMPARPVEEGAKVEKVVVRLHLTIRNLWS